MPWPALLTTASLPQSKCEVDSLEALSTKLTADLRKNIRALVSLLLAPSTPSARCSDCPPLTVRPRRRAARPHCPPELVPCPLGAVAHSGNLGQPHREHHRDGEQPPTPDTTRCLPALLPPAGAALLAADLPNGTCRFALSKNYRSRPCRRSLRTPPCGSARSWPCATFWRTASSTCMCAGAGEPPTTTPPTVFRLWLCLSLMCAPPPLVFAHTLILIPTSPAHCLHPGTPGNL